MLVLGVAVLVIATAPAGASTSSEGHSPDRVPKLSITYEGFYDQRCGVGRVPEPGVRDELRRRLKDFQSTWAAFGPRLMKVTRELARQPYRFSEAEVALHGCSNFGSVSSPFLIAAGRYTDAWAAASESDGTFRTRHSMSEFVNSIWHEVHHRYVREILAARTGGLTPLLRKYAQESAPTRNHLHLFALERLAWDRIGLGSEQDKREAQEFSNGEPELRRAYGIVRAEGAQAFVQELWP